MMNWVNVRLILERELRDQLRDRRTIFTVAVLPLLLYPLMGISLIQVTQFLREHSTRIWFVGHEHLSVELPLIDGDRIAEQWGTPKERGLIELRLADQSDSEFQRLISEFKKQEASKDTGPLINSYIQQELVKHDADLAVFIPKPVELPSATAAEGEHNASPTIYLFLNTASDRSRIAADRMKLVLSKWREALTRTAMAREGLSVALLEPFQIGASDIADKQGRRAAAWSKILPMLIMVWSLTGAFYPAVDLCAGEKERGTFETLLSSPANRSEIAIGKLLTVMIFSIATCALNFLSMGITSCFVLVRMGGAIGAGPLSVLELPPTNSLIWLGMAVVPIAALFSAVSLAAAAFARSSREGQYYLVPLIMICIPLMIIPILPASKLDLGTSLIPVTGLMLLLRSLIEGNYQAAIQFFGPVCSVTLICCWLSIRWVVSQFNSEAVLFRASERFDLTRWIRIAFQQRGPLPTVGHAILCATTILVIKFFASFVVSPPRDFHGFALQTVIILFATVAMPAILMAIMLTRRADQSLKLQWCRPSLIAAACLAAFCLSPIFSWASALVMQLYPPSQSLGGLQQTMAGILGGAPSLAMVIVVLAIVPALFEELAYRGFIHSGLQTLKNPVSAIVWSSLFFGAAHAVFQQSILAFLVGVVLALIAWKTKSLIPCVLYHSVHNGLAIILGEVPANHWGAFRWLVYENSSGLAAFQLIPGTFLAATGVLLLVWICRAAPNPKTNSDEKRPAFLAGLPIVAHWTWRQRLA